MLLSIKQRQVYAVDGDDARRERVADRVHVLLGLGEAQLTRHRVQLGEAVRVLLGLGEKLLQLPVDAAKTFPRRVVIGEVARDEEPAIAVDAAYDTAVGLHNERVVVRRPPSLLDLGRRRERPIGAVFNGAPILERFAERREEGTYELRVLTPEHVARALVRVRDDAVEGVKQHGLADVVEQRQVVEARVELPKRGEHTYDALGSIAERHVGDDPRLAERMRNSLVGVAVPEDLLREGAGQAPAPKQKDVLAARVRSVITAWPEAEHAQLLDILAALGHVTHRAKKKSSKA